MGGDQSVEVVLRTGLFLNRPLRRIGRVRNGTSSGHESAVKAGSLRREATSDCVFDVVLRDGLFPAAPSSRDRALPMTRSARSEAKNASGVECRRGQRHRDDCARALVAGRRWIQRRWMIRCQLAIRALGLKHGAFASPSSSGLRTGAPRAAHRCATRPLAAARDECR